MDGVSEDFSGLPEYKTRGERRSERIDRRWRDRRSNPYRGRRTKIILVAGFSIAILGVVIALIMSYVPAPFLGVNSSNLAQSFGAKTIDDCRPNTGGWVCIKQTDGGTARYQVTSDWVGCWKGKEITTGPKAGRPDSVSGCVSLMDHLKAD